MPSIDTRNVITQIAVNNGDTAVIGGIYEETITNDRRRRCRCSATSRSSAICSRRRTRGSEKHELLIFLTPRVVKDTVNAVK